ncbi:hypothetical protein A9B99_13830 [Mangrovibacter phragmitis]|uniref:DUF2569 domain-containing protein n=1 Tax=Mangrovibacter phragmitis TaxID=1691903 RepID=A0A1B7L103_9ENTR|nr:DUF2569 domain-containing protein [Mangrovibacter phragmitis]OAT75885.1 hypothetical protein A9B99_13830 [Mangrovibacter phragmitis]
MKCIQCNGLESNKESGLCDSCEQKELRKINGLLYLPALGLISGCTLGLFDLYTYIDAVVSYFRKTGFISYYAMGAVAFLLAGYVISLGASWFFFRCKSGIRKIMVINYVIRLLSALYLTVLPILWFQAPFDSYGMRALTGAAVGVLVWIPYFLFSKRIDTVFCK